MKHKLLMVICSISLLPGPCNLFFPTLEVCSQVVAIIWPECSYAGRLFRANEKGLSAPKSKDVLFWGGNGRIMHNKSHIVLCRNKKFSSQLTHENTIYEIRHDFDLRDSYTGLNLFSRIAFAEDSYYTHDPAIALEACQAIWIPSDCIVLSFTKDSLLSDVGFYKPSSATYVYIASKTKKRITYQLDGMVTIPPGCVLIFNGGSLKNGRVTGNKTQILNGANSPIMAAIEIGGTWDNKKVFSGWFSDANERNVIRSIFKLATSGSIINIDAGSYYLDFCHTEDDLVGITVPQNCVVNNRGRIVCRTNNANTYEALRLSEGSKFCGGALVLDKDESSSEKGWGMGITSYSNNVIVSEIEITGCLSDGIYLRGDQVSVLNCIIHDCGRNGISCTKGNKVVIEGNSIFNITGNAPRTCIDIEPNVLDSVSNCIIVNNKMYDSGAALSVFGRSFFTEQVLISKNTITGCPAASILASKCKGVVIADNIIDAPQSIIRLISCEGASVASNKCVSGNARYAFNIDRQCSGVEFANNHFEAIVSSYSNAKIFYLSDASFLSNVFRGSVIILGNTVFNYNLVYCDTVDIVAKENDNVVIKNNTFYLNSSKKVISALSSDYSRGSMIVSGNTIVNGQGL